jgi:hypothetical protein
MISVWASIVLLFLAAQLVDIEKLKQAAPVFFGEFVTTYIINSALAMVEYLQACIHFLLYFSRILSSKLFVDAEKCD